MKTYLLFFSLLISSLAGFAQPNVETREIEILPESSLSISGNTNISEFECDFNTIRFKEQSITVHFSSKGDILDFRNSILPLKNTNFDCGNRRINKDFRELLKTEKHPEILLKIQQIEMDDKQNAHVTLNFEIAGKNKNYRFPVRLTGDDQLCFEGNLALNIKDFDLEAPSKMFGLIVIEEEININFKLNIKA
ncbi:YceI family protein [Salegentibacter sediminis]|uniref:YceI family protein n=1 Tax=Salegentibacter sediminis TaxID=1930251 RepID=UPI0009BDC5D1|nr:YceI family protein [Salegentibacter sediminis]